MPAQNPYLTEPTDGAVTILFIPEKSASYRRFVVPLFRLKIVIWVAGILFLLGTLLLLDYWFALNQVERTRDIRIENRHLRQQIQEYRARLEHARGELDSLAVFSKRLRVFADLKGKSTAQAQTQESLNIADSRARVRPPIAMEHLDNELDNTFKEMLHSEEVLHDLYELLIDQKTYFAALPTRKPAIGYFTSGFGVRDAPIGGIAKMHEGVDIANHQGTMIRATADGIVSFAGHKGGYGNTITIDHGYGLETWYGHCRKILVKNEQVIRRGDPIALMGSSGQSTGPHVHYEVRVNKIPVDPLSYILED